MERAAVADLMFMAHHGQVGWYDDAWVRLDRLLRDGERRKATQEINRRADAFAEKEALKNDETRSIFEAGKQKNAGKQTLPRWKGRSKSNWRCKTGTIMGSVP